MRLAVSGIRIKAGPVVRHRDDRAPVARHCADQDVLRRMSHTDAVFDRIFHYGLKRESREAERRVPDIEVDAQVLSEANPLDGQVSFRVPELVGEADRL